MSNDRGIHGAKRRASWNAYRQKHLEERRAAARKSSRKIAGLPEPTRPLPQRCECCGNIDTRRALCLDHDHDTNAFRGWLCNKCNIGIGHLNDNLDGVLKAVKYLTGVHSN